MKITESKLISFFFKKDFLIVNKKKIYIYIHIL